ncbi:hypothetical protein VNO78_25178 [Psophocarpus tetragonolobus]|uniref:Uncharacterized protein n=1 Tax=Psophocarpus tetragonolobus TaxID=3891 RepID=A0AAN9S618_PSOTE
MEAQVGGLVQNETNFELVIREGQVATDPGIMGLRKRVSNTMLWDFVEAHRAEIARINEANQGRLDAIQQSLTQVLLNQNPVHDSSS